LSALATPQGVSRGARRVRSRSLSLVVYGEKVEA
jgi:hypothetical protein